MIPVRNTFQPVLLLLAVVFALPQTVAAEEWLLLEFTRNLPPCENAQPGDRCWGTQAEIASFEIRSGETLSLPHSGLLPPAWVQLRQLWVSAADATANDKEFTISVDRTPGGARLQMSDGGIRYLQSLQLNEWARLMPVRGENFPAGRPSGGNLVWARIVADPGS